MELRSMTSPRRCISPSLQAAIDEQRDSIQESMMRRYDQRFQELKDMEQGSLVMVEAKHISVPAKKVAGLMECKKLDSTAVPGSEPVSYTHLRAHET